MGQTSSDRRLRSHVPELPDRWRRNTAILSETGRWLAEDLTADAPRTNKAVSDSAPDDPDSASDQPRGSRLTLSPVWGVDSASVQPGLRQTLRWIIEAQHPAFAPRVGTMHVQAAN